MSKPKPKVSVKHGRDLINHADANRQLMCNVWLDDFRNIVALAEIAVASEGGIIGPNEAVALAENVKIQEPHPGWTVGEFTLETGKGRSDHTIPMILFCPNGHRHTDEGEFATKAHHTHACQECGIVWRPSRFNTHGVRFLPGYTNDQSA